MKPSIPRKLIFGLMLSSQICLAQQSQFTERFDGRTPCQSMAAQLKQSVGPECIKIKWRLMLYRKDDGSQHGNYTLEGFVFRKEKMLSGNWTIMKGTAVDPVAIVYMLENSEFGPIFLQKADDDVLFFLDAEKKIRVGNQDFSYGLNRVK